ncbi:MAG: xanthan lyase [Rikenellaceae bacterium]|nr:xanthan lyase [Rikenellaceae bacterium]
MSFIPNIRAVAKYESKLLLRSWFFKVFVGVAILVLGLLDMQFLFGQYSPWLLKAFPANIPYFNILFLNVGEAVIAVFLASEFLKRDKKLDTLAVFYVRPVSNAEYVLGKIWGCLRVFLIINLIIYAVAILLNLIAPGVHVALEAYLYYFLLITIPTLIYIIGFSVFVMQLIRNQALTFVILLGYIALTVFYVGDKYYGLFDYMAWNLPMFRSQIAGAPNFEVLLTQRLIYLFWGLGFIFLNVVMFRRLSNYAYSNIAWLVLAVCMFGLGGYTGYIHVRHSLRDLDNKKAYVALNNRYVHTPKIVTDRYLLDVEQQPRGIRATCVIEGTALDSSDRFTFTLNPGLRVLSIESDSTELRFERDRQILLVDFGRVIPRDSTVSLTVRYEGSIDETFCYLDIPEDELLKPNKEEWGLTIGKQYAFQQPDYLLLTPETYWYPRPGTGYSDQSADWQQTYFSNFELAVRPLPGLRPISQGAMEDDSSGVFRFVPENQMQSASLVIGDYTRRSITVDSVQFNYWQVKGVDFGRSRFDTIADTLPSLIRNIRNEAEFFNRLSYPFKRFSVIEVPAQFASYSRAWTRAQETMQPEMVLFPEKGSLDSWAFNIDVQLYQMKMMAQWGGGPAMNERDMLTAALNQILRIALRKEMTTSFERGRKQTVSVETVYNPYYIFPQLYNFRYNIYSAQWPIANRLIELYLQNESTSADYDRNWNGLSKDEKANLLFQEKTFAELLADPKNRDLTDNLIGLQGGRLFSRAALNFGEDKVRDSVYAVLKDYTFKNLRFETLLDTLGRITGTDIRSGMADWTRLVPMAAYEIDAPKVLRFIDRGEELYQFEITVTNASGNPGIFSIYFPWVESANPDAPKSGKWMIELGPHQTKQIIRHWRTRPQWVDIFGFVAANLPLFVNQQIQFTTDENLSKKRPEGEYVIERASREEPGAIVVDNEDSLLFELSPPRPSGYLSRWLDKTDKNTFKYAGVPKWWGPIQWTLNTQPTYYGGTIRSAYVIRPGKGDQYVIWKVPLPEKGRYEVYYHATRPDMLQWRSGPAELHFVIDDGGKQDEYLDLNRAINGWNSLGTYHFDTDTVRVTLTDECQVNPVTADAVKFVKR